MVKKHKHNDTLQKTTITFGYGLFIAFVLSVTLSTVIPFSVIAFDSRARHINVIAIMLSLTLSAVLPLILAYIIGDKSTRTKNETSHHFNGVLLGFAAYWLSVFIGLINSDLIVDIRHAVSGPLASVVVCWPVVLTFLIVLWVALNYTLRRRGTLLEHGPYQALLIAGMIAVSAYSLSPIYIIVPVVVVGVAYILLSQITPRMTRLTVAVLAYTIGMIAVTLTWQIVTGSLFMTMLSSYIVGLLVWAAYLWCVRSNR